MDSYEIRWKIAAQQDLQNIDPQQVPKIINAIERLVDNPFPLKHRKLRGSEQDYRIRVGNYRVIYQVDTEAKIVIIFYVRHRREAYRK